MRNFPSPTQDFVPVIVTEKQEPGRLNLHEVQGLREGLTERIVSRPASGCRQIFNFYYNPTTERFIIVMEGDSEQETETISFKIGELARVVTNMLLTLEEQDVMGEPYYEGYELTDHIETLQDDLDVEL